MATETERKFLVSGDFRRDSYRSERIVQGYLSSDPGRTVRVRIRGGKGYLTIKGASDGRGISRFEWENEIPLEDAEEMLKMAEPGKIEKTRHLVKNTDGRHIWEIDVFEGDNEGLTVAEIELVSPDEPFDRPEWLGLEVTGDKRYYNAYLSSHPYSEWHLSPVEE